MRTAVVILNFFLLTVLLMDHVGAQGIESGKIATSGNQLSLGLESKVTHNVVTLVVGEVLTYKLQSSRHFIAGQITGFTDSTISIESKSKRKDTIRYKELAALKIPKSSRKKATGHILIVVGAWILVGVTVNPAEGTSTFLNYIAYPIGVLAIIKGYSIKREEKIILDDTWSWTLKETKLINAIERGSFVKVILKNGTIIEEMKIDKVDAEQIQGFEISQDSHEQFVYTFRTIGVSDIENLIVKKR